MRAGSRSRTSDWVAGLRALYSEAPSELAVLDDPIAERLLPTGLRWFVRGASRAPFGVRVAHRALGSLSLGLSFGVPLRTAAIDDAVHRSVDEGVRQLVLLGAGLDARAWRMPRLDDVTVFEIDHPDTQAYKRAQTLDLQPLARDVRFCAIDFERDTIGQVLGADGFARNEPAMWIWEGVTMYLTPESVTATLDAIGELAAVKSRVAITYLPTDYAAPWVRKVTEAGGRIIGEAVRCVLDPKELGVELRRRGFETESDTSAIEWSERWPSREAKRVRPFERLVVARRVDA
jgi:methyltransferase (TIGR00027 family)